MKKRTALVIFVICILYLVLSSLFTSEESKIRDEISNIDDTVAEMNLTEEVDDGLFCLSTADTGRIMITYLRKQKWSDTGYELGGQTICSPELIVNNRDPSKFKKFRILNFSKESYYYCFYTDKSVKTLKIDDRIVIPSKVSFTVYNQKISGYFWFYKSIKVPNVEVVRS